MTGWAVVHGRNDLPVNSRRELDVWYADHATFLLDLKILCKTMALVVGRRGINRPGPAQPHEISQPAGETPRCSSES